MDHFSVVTLALKWITFTLSNSLLTDSKISIDDPAFKESKDLTIISQLSDWKTIHMEVQNFLFSLDSFDAALRLLKNESTESDFNKLEEDWLAYCDKGAEYVKKSVEALSQTYHELAKLHNALHGRENIRECIVGLRVGDKASIQSLRGSFRHLKQLVQDVLRLTDLFIRQIAEELKTRYPHIPNKPITNAVA